MLRWAKSVRYIKNLLRYGHSKKYISIANVSLRPVLNFMKQTKNTAVSYWNVFLWMAISQPIYNIFDWFSIILHYCSCSFRQWRANWEIQKIDFCDVITLPLLQMVNSVTKLHFLSYKLFQSWGILDLLEPCVAIWQPCQVKGLTMSNLKFILTFPSVVHLQTSPEYFWQPTGRIRLAPASKWYQPPFFHRIRGATQIPWSSAEKTTNKEQTNKQSSKMLFSWDAMCKQLTS